MANDISFPVAFLAGMLSFFLPCVLPIIPGYIGFLTGVSLHRLSDSTPSRWLLLYHSLFFVFGFLIVFVALGVAIGAFAQWLALSRLTWSRIGGMFLIAMGLYLTHWIPWSVLYRTRTFQPSPNTQRKTRITLLSSLLTGLTFGFSWTPCIGPVLATILLLATYQGGSLRGSLLLLLFAIGLGVPFVLTAIIMDRLLPYIRSVVHTTALLQKLSGIIIMALGVLLVTGWYWDIQTYLVRFTKPLL